MKHVGCLLSKGLTIFNWSLSVQLTALPTYSVLVTERKIVGVVISVNLQYCSIGVKKGQGETAVILRGDIIALAVIHGLESKSMRLFLNLW